MLRTGFLFVVLALASPLFGTGMPAHVARHHAPPQGDIAPPPPSGKLTEDGKLAIVRQVDGEFAKAVQPLPSIKSGFLLRPGQKIDQQALKSALIMSLPAANPGDKVQITGIKFKRKEIVVNINGGSNPHENWRNRIHLSVGMPFPTVQPVAQNQPPGIQRIGSTLILDFGRAVPNVSPAQVKQYLSPFLNFAGQPSAAKAWIDTIPPQFRQAITQRKAVVGMNKQMVMAALGETGRKVREFQPDGTETEDWIYGNPPGTTIFVTFIGDKVVRVRQFP
jgi:hypothetical protein